ncbi:MAG: DNA-formamidopyrimidine glycosylase [Aggregatilineales bacterium]
MPELPEVETVVRGLREPLVGHTIESVWYDWLPIVAEPDIEQFIARSIGQRVEAISRRAKYIIIHLQDAYLVVHLRMTGRLYVAEKDAEYNADRWVHLKFGLDGGKELRFSNSRKFGRVSLLENLDSLEAKLGPEPLSDDFTPDIFAERMKKRNKVIKALLLDQSFIAGVGNIYADEALFGAGVHPTQRSTDLTKAQVKTLYATVRDALNAGIEHEGASISWYRKPDGTSGSSQKHFFVYGREGQPCHNCGRTIEKIRVAQRGTHFCPQCQPIKHAKT